MDPHGATARPRGTDPLPVHAGKRGGPGRSPGGGDRPQLPVQVLQQQPLVSHQRVLRQVRYSYFGPFFGF